MPWAIVLALLIVLLSIVLCFMEFKERKKRQAPNQINYIQVNYSGAASENEQN